ncbi:MAG: OmpH family outer membrane protein [Oscillibacter sp.]|nr:OmpH family outer membrane protein [Oscillibacter sp.]
MMKNTMKWLAVIAFMFAAMSMSAQQKPLKLGHIESDKLIAAMPEMAEARKKLEAKQTEIQTESQNLREQYQNKAADYAKNVNTYSDVIRTSKEQEIQELGQRIQRFEETAMNDLNKTRDDLLHPIYEKATNAIKEVGKENGFTYIFDLNSGGIVYVSETSEDILPLVKKKLGLQ